jgi:hypothetical protein
VPELSDTQVEQVVAWSAAGGTPRSILVRITDDNRDDTGLAPWPAELTEHDLDVVIDEHEGRRLALYGKRLLSRTSIGGLAGRASQASAAIDRLHEIDRQIEMCTAQFERLLRAGAFDLAPFISEERLDEANALYSQMFDGAIKNKDGSHAVVIARPDGRYKISTSAIAVGDALLRRAMALGKHIIGLRQVRVKEAEVLAKVTGHGITREPMPEEGFIGLG